MNEQRYSRQIRFAGLGVPGQARLAAATVAIIGMGATGSAVFQALLRAGVGQLRIVDRDWVEEHNLPRQSLYDEADVAAQTPKAIAAAAHGARINSAAQITPLVLDVHAATLDTAIGAADLVIDGADNLELRALLNAWCVRAARPWIYTGVLGGHGMTATLQPDGPCLRCYFPTWPTPGSQPTCETAGVVGPLVQVLAGLAATEALKLLAGSGTPNPGLLIVDGWNWSFDQLPAAPRRPECPICGQRDWSVLEPDAGAVAALCGRDAVQVRPAQPSAVGLERLGERLAQAGLSVRSNTHLLRFAADGHQITVFPDGRAIISGTDDLIQARSLYARWIGA